MVSNSEKLYRRRNYNNNLAETAVRKINAQDRVENIDTQTRKEIQNRIIDLVRKGKTTEEIKGILSQEPRYSKYSKYFQSWIENCQRKLQPQKQKEEEER